MADADEAAGVGRPTLYREEYAEQAAKLCRLGATDIELADFFEVATSTLYLWKSTHPEFSEALKAGKEASDERVKRSLYAKAVGYSFDSVKIFNSEGVPLVVPYREHVPPSDTAAIFWLKNRQPKEWRDRVENVHTGPDGGPMVTTTITTTDPVEAARAYQKIIRGGAA
ncbi:MAG: helix-turn-helix domain-containing protein [Roseomonas sp.]|nr:helix-turn-helix domain-containing protein [Roseomonas sp.]